MTAFYQKISRKATNLSARIRAKRLARVWPDKSIVFYTGSTPNQWSPHSLATGIGGAEGRIIHLSQEWVQQGYQVTVFNNCGEHEGIYSGVHYLNHEKFNPLDTFDTLIIWHFAWRIRFPVKANRVWLDLGKGVLLPEESTYEKLKGYDKIFCKNAFHRSTLPEIPDHKIVIIPNGLVPEANTLKDIPKDPNKLIYASNYSRGLERMLEFGWPLIKSAIPQAELHLFYGWPQDVNLTWKSRMIELMNQPGVIDHGKVGREQLMFEKASSTIHYYGCTFQEIDCNTVRESALVGCIPVTTDYAGLKDKDYCLKVSGNPFHQSTQEALAYKIIDLINKPEEISQLREQYSELVQQETWDKIAVRWLQEID